MGKKDDDNFPFQILDRENMIKLQTKVKKIKSSWLDNWRRRYIVMIVLSLLLGGLFAGYQFFLRPEVSEELEQENFKVEIEEQENDLMERAEDFSLRQEVISRTEETDDVSINDKTDDRIEEEKAKEDKRVDKDKDVVRVQTSSNNLLLPIEGEKTNVYQWYKDELLDVWRFNPGVDIIATAGSDVKVADSGEVESVIEDDYSGMKVIISHSGGLRTFYLNLDDVEVESGEQISRGEKIGIIKQNDYYDRDYIRFKIKQDEQYIEPSEYFEF